MVTDLEAVSVELLPIAQISVSNPRVRSKRTFQELVDSISRVGLKKPITVSRRTPDDGMPHYELVCGQGRLEAFVRLGQQEIPAIVVNITEQDRMLRSVVENIARRQHSPLELLHDIGQLSDRGYSDPDIAAKTGLSYEYVHAIRRLLERGEERLIAAVETGQIPISVAIDIAEADAEGAQTALAEAYEFGILRGKKLLAARHIIEQRQRKGKRRRTGSKKARPHMSSDALVRAYQKEVNRQRVLIQRAEFTQSRLLFIVEAMRSLLADENFVTLLRAEGLETLPRPLADRIAGRDP